MAFKPEVFVRGETWTRNGLVFATHEEALDNARDTYVRWIGCEAYHAVEVDEPVNSRWVNYRLEAM